MSDLFSSRSQAACAVPSTTPLNQPVRYVPRRIPTYRLLAYFQDAARPPALSITLPQQLQEPRSRRTSTTRWVGVTKRTIQSTPFRKLAPWLDRRHLMLVPYERQAWGSRRHVPLPRMFSHYKKGQRSKEQWSGIVDEKTIERVRQVSEVF